MNPISFAIIGGHGWKDGIQFGGNDDRHLLHVDDLKGTGTMQIQRGGFVEESGTLILVSCETGQAEGIAEKLSQKLDLSVIAPDKPTNIRSIRAKYNQQGQVYFEVEYTDQNARVVYLRGVNTSKAA